MKTEAELLREALAHFGKKMKQAGIDLTAIKNRSTQQRQPANLLHQ